jgi:hypothetical protein
MRAVKRLPQNSPVAHFLYDAEYLNLDEPVIGGHVLHLITAYNGIYVRPVTNRSPFWSVDWTAKYLAKIPLRTIMNEDVPGVM